MSHERYFINKRENFYKIIIDIHRLILYLNNVKFISHRCSPYDLSLYFKIYVRWRWIYKIGLWILTYNNNKYITNHNKKIFYLYLFCFNIAIRLIRARRTDSLAVSLAKSSRTKCGMLGPQWALLIYCIYAIVYSLQYKTKFYMDLKLSTQNGVSGLNTSLNSFVNNFLTKTRDS